MCAIQQVLVQSLGCAESKISLKPSVSTWNFPLSPRCFPLIALELFLLDFFKIQCIISCLWPQQHVGFTCCLAAFLFHRHVSTCAGMTAQMFLQLKPKFFSYRNTFSGLQSCWQNRAWFGCGCCVFCLVLFFVVPVSLFFCPGEFWFQSQLIPAVDRPCLALVRQCRKKKKKKGQVVFFGCMKFFVFLGPWLFLLILWSNNDNTCTAQWLPQL